MTRDEFQRLSRARIREARILLNANQYSGSYYLAGYSLECGLKACIAKSYPRYTFPDKRKVINSHTHDLESLIKVANLSHQLTIDTDANLILKANWATAKDWSEVSRYEIKTRIEAQDIYSSITQRNNGLLRWIRQYW